jgi:hypothetical protein
MYGAPMSSLVAENFDETKRNTSLITHISHQQGIPFQQSTPLASS